MSETSLIDELRKLLATERAKLKRVSELESEISALKNANQRLHEQMRELQSRPAIALAFRASRALDAFPRLKGTLKNVAKMLK